MNESRAKFLILLAVAAVLAIGFLWFRGAERQILKQVQQIAEAIEKSGPESELTAFANSRAVTEVFAQSFEIKAPEFQFATSERRAVAAQVHMYRSQSEKIDVDTFDRQLTVSGQSAEMLISVSFSGTTLAGVTGREAFRFRVAWFKEKEWKIRQLELLEILEDSGRLGF